MFKDLMRLMSLVSLKIRQVNKPGPVRQKRGGTYEEWVVDPGNSQFLAQGMLEAIGWILGWAQGQIAR